MTYASTEPTPLSVAAMMAAARARTRPSRARTVSPLAVTAADLHRAALTVASNATDTEDAADLLDALGLVDLLRPDRPTWRT